ncbi:MAG: hypothetical protein JWM32_2744 [Verrucomicrobia bacterium]|nr:hypothetical protein [Verrucomicrobiota bacterium]
MNELLALWLPILLSAVVVFVISSLVHMLLKWHSSDYGTLPNEDAVRDAIRAGNPAPGRYVMPRCKEMKEMASEAMKKKYAEGPVGHLTLLPNGMPKMGKYLGQWFLWSLVIAVVAAYLPAHIYGLGHFHARSAAKLAGIITFIAHGFGTISESIWTGRPWSQSVKYLIDAALYAIGSAVVFLWLWP